MGRRLFFILCVCSLSHLPAQDGFWEWTPLEPGEGIIPLYLLLEEAAEAQGGHNPWRPDWPLSLPPDAFSLTVPFSRIALGGDDYVLELRFDSLGRLLAFPLSLKGRMAQVSLAYRDYAGEIADIEVFFSFEEEPYYFEFLEHIAEVEALIRVEQGDYWFFVTIHWGLNEVIETWYDEIGNALGAYLYSLIEVQGRPRLRQQRELNPLMEGSPFTRHYDSWGLISELEGPGGTSRVLYYRDNLPRFWEASGIPLTLQWDGQDRLVRLWSDAPGVLGALDYRYEYRDDPRGNWSERREIRMIPSMGVLVPSAGPVHWRMVEYAP
ncbi:MAG: hypothetical protein FWH12_03465 [Treponema sp.]|nr:hypothetical protein [Treponema sp.]